MYSPSERLHQICSHIFDNLWVHRDGYSPSRKQTKTLKRHKKYLKLNNANEEELTIQFKRDTKHCKFPFRAHKNIIERIRSYYNMLEHIITC